MDTSKQLSIEDGNRIIAEFMELEKCSDPSHVDNPCYVVPYAKGYHKIKDMQFHSSWDWLMPAWVKFVSEYHRLGNNGIYHPTRKIRSEFHDGIDKGEILKSFNVIVDGIQWYQSNKQL